jgi:hypothetical protein
MSIVTKPAAVNRFRRDFDKSRDGASLKYTFLAIFNDSPRH